MDIKKIVPELCKYGDEQEWFEFKVNWFEPIALGEYVSALSNAAAFIIVSVLSLFGALIMIRTKSKEQTSISIVNIRKSLIRIF